MVQKHRVLYLLSHTQKHQFVLASRWNFLCALWHMVPVSSVGCLSGIGWISSLDSIASSCSAGGNMDQQKGLSG